MLILLGLVFFTGVNKITIKSVKGQHRELQSVSSYTSHSQHSWSRMGLVLPLLVAGQCALLLPLLVAGQCALLLTKALFWEIKKNGTRVITIVHVKELLSAFFLRLSPLELLRVVENQHNLSGVLMNSWIDRRFD